MERLVDFLVENIHIVSFIYEAFVFSIFLYLSYSIVRSLHDRDFTYKNITTIHNGMRFADMVGIKERKRKKPLYEQFNFIKAATDKAKVKFLLLDEERSIVINTYLLMKYVFPIVIFFIAMMQGIDVVGRAVIVLPIIWISPEIYIKVKQNQHVKSFENYSYKLFKFINNQRSAGVPTQKIITKLHLVVNDEKLKKRLISFAADYIANNNYDESFKKHIKKYYSTSDALAVDNALSQGLNVGDRYTISDESEELMFDKYLAYIDYETERKKFKSVLVASLFAFTLLGLVGYPLVMDMFKSIEIIFG
ncbi:MAG: hypothetical protein JEZ08_16560 [Clostridiales bacterium]|nr:hypothetical protein [Clostridiales bacterium]